MGLFTFFFFFFSNFEDKTHFLAFNYSLLKYSLHPTLYLIIYFIKYSFIISRGVEEEKREREDLKRENRIQLKKNV